MGPNQPVFNANFMKKADYICYWHIIVIPVVQGYCIRYSDYNSPAFQIEHFSYTCMYNVSPGRYDRQASELMTK